MATKKLGEIADRLARKIADNRDQPEWEQDLLEAIDWATGQELDFKVRDILFGMIVRRWDRVKKARVEYAAQHRSAVVAAEAGNDRPWRAA